MPNIHAEAEANEAYARAEHMKFLYPPPPPFTRSQQFNKYLQDASGDWPDSVVLPMWIGCVYRWLDHPSVGEEEMFRGAKEELGRLNDERRK